MTALMEQECELERTGDGVYERECGRVWWGHEAQHGGYVMALAMTAVCREVADEAMGLQHCTVHYMRPFVDGPFRAEVEVVRRGRTMANATARLYSGGRESALVLASLATRRPVAEFIAAEPPEVAPVGGDEEPWVPWFHVPTFDRVQMYRRLDDTTGPGARRVGGWVVPRTPEVIDHRYLAFVVDMWPPFAYHRWAGPVTAQSVDITYHARAVLPRAEPAPGSPLLVVLTTAASAGGFVDEDAAVWTAEGELLALSRQMRYVHSSGARGDRAGA